MLSTAPEFYTKLWSTPVSNPLAYTAGGGLGSGQGDFGLEPNNAPSTPFCKTPVYV